jgi:hypothetical protein
MPAVLALPLSWMYLPVLSRLQYLRRHLLLPFQDCHYPQWSGPATRLQTHKPQD